MEKLRRGGDITTSSDATTIAIADVTASRRNGSAPMRRNELMITTPGSATSAASHTSASFIAISSIARSRSSRRQHSATQPLVDSRQQARPAVKGLDHDAIQGAVQKSAFKREQEQAMTCAIRRQHCPAATASRGVVTHRLFEAVQIVEDVGRAQELQQSEAGVSGQVDERDRVPTDRDLNDDETDLRERRIRQRRFHVALHARGD